MAVCDASGTLTFLSPALQELLGQSFGSEVEAASAAATRLYRDDGLTSLRPKHFPLARARRGEVVTDVVICYRSEDEVPAYLRCNAAPIDAADGSVNGAVVFVEDVTAGYVSHQNHQRMQNHLISTLNHELRTPLTKLMGHAEMLRDLRSQLPLNAVHSLEKLCQAADELSELADLVSCLADLDTPGLLMEAIGDPADSSQDDPWRVPEQLARGRLRSVPKIPLQPDDGPDPDGVITAIALLAQELPSPRQGVTPEERCPEE
jgi:signal transduction histidine kinase